MSKSMFPHLEAIKGFELSRNGLIGPGKGKKGPWLHREAMMKAAQADHEKILKQAEHYYMVLRAIAEGRYLGDQAQLAAQHALRA